MDHVSCSLGDIVNQKFGTDDDMAGQPRKWSLPESSSFSIVERTKNALSTQRSNSSFGITESAEDIKGPLGLNLLHSPSQCVLVDFIFVHGLGGGSRKTWSKTADSYHFWPKEWLKNEPEFKYVRIYSFGYNSTWGERKGSTLDINDFSRGLISEMKDDPGMRKASTPIVLVGHSMGGVVIKQAYILAKQDAAFQELAARFHTIFFLATPHRGSNMAKVLTNILKLTYGQKPYVNELESNSITISTINDTFRHFAHDLQLRSFYETLETRLAVFEALIVDPDSAMLGYAQERVAPLNVDHRGICKFDNTADSNYKTLRKAFAATVDSITSHTSVNHQDASKDELHRLATLTGILGIPEDDLMVLEDARVVGTCEWFTMANDFQAWRLALPNYPLIFWLHGHPATGKSILASSVIDYLRTLQLQPCFFFFKHGTTTQSSLGNCLLSIAYQMAVQDDQIRQCLLTLESEGSKLNKDDERTIWRKVFVEGIFRIQNPFPRYWIIDALDECKKLQPIFSMLSQAQNHNIRIFITSRNSPEIERGVFQTAKSALEREIQPSDTINDMKAFITSRLDRLPVEIDDEEHSDNLISKILSKSAGSFLWVRLVVQELENTWSEEAVDEVLDEIPPDMDLLYTRTLDNMSKMRRGLKLAKAILSWTVCALRPLTVHELQYALKLDIKETVHNLERSIASICGQLVFVDQQSRVQIIHQTARDFLLREDLDSYFAINKIETHTRIAQICLEFLSSDTFHGIKANKDKIGFRTGIFTDIPFMNYACVFFSNHMSRTSSEDTELMDLLYDFLKSNVLSWIEHISGRGSVNDIIRTATNLKSYLNRRAKYFPPIGEQVKTVEAWIVDLIRVTAKFGPQLIAFPTSIHLLVPPMCPSESIIHKTYTSSHRGLVIEGLPETNWDDCLVQIDYTGSRATALDHGEQFFAVGLSKGQIIVYHQSSFRMSSKFDHGDKVEILKFGNRDETLASSSRKCIRVWDIRSNSLIFDMSSSRALSLGFAEENKCLLAALHGGYVACWEIESNVELSRIPWTDGSSEKSAKSHFYKIPSMVAFSRDYSLLAMTHRNQPIHLFNLQNETFWGTCQRDSNSKSTSHYPVVAMAFNPNPDQVQLVVSYGDGELVLYDVMTLKLRWRISNVNAHSLGCAPDGRTLATGSPFGTIQIFDLSSIEISDPPLMYRINTHEEGIKSLCFSSDGLRFLDIRGSQCRVWEPAVLVRKDLVGSSSSEISDPFSVAVKEIGLLEGDGRSEITAIFSDPDGDFLFGGREDGSVMVLETEKGQENCSLYRHETAIICVAWGKRTNILVTADIGAAIIVSQIDTTTSPWSVSKVLAQKSLKTSITDIFINNRNDRILICGLETIELCTITGEVILSRVFNSQNPRVVPLFDGPENFAVFIGTQVQIFTWSEFIKLSDAGISLERDLPNCPGGCVLNIEYHRNSNIIFEMITTSPTRTDPILTCWDICNFRPQQQKHVKHLMGFESFGIYVQHIISITETRFTYLDTDLWVCSLDLTTFRSTQQVKRHFFIPSDWRSTTREMLFKMTSKSDFIFVKKDRLVVIKRGLENSNVFSLK